MKHYIQYAVIILFTLLWGTIEAQKFEGHILKMPREILEGGGKVYVEIFSDKNAKDAKFGESYAEALKKALQATRVAYGNLGTVHNPWLTTKIYEVTDAKADADYIISGEYEISSSSSKSNKEVWIKETNDNNPKIPVCYYNYTISNSATVKGNLFLKTKGEDAAYKTLPFNQKKGKSKTKALEAPNVKPASTYVSSAKSAAIKQYEYFFSPIIIGKKYNFKNLRGEDRDQRKQLRKERREIKDLADKGDIMTIGKMYIESLKMNLKDKEDGFLNVGMCYEIIGNYTKAKEYYEKSGDKGALKDINQLISDRNILAKMGLEVIEKDFK